MASKGPNKKAKATKAEKANEERRKTIEKISNITTWTPDDIAPILAECNNNAELTIDKILSGDAGRRGEEWTQVTRVKKQKEQTPPVQDDVEVVQDRDVRKFQDTRPNTRGQSRDGQRYDNRNKRGSNDGRRKPPYSPGSTSGQHGQNKRGAGQMPHNRRPNGPNSGPRPSGQGYEGGAPPSGEYTQESQAGQAAQHMGISPAGPQPVNYSQALTQSANVNESAVMPQQRPLTTYGNSHNNPRRPSGDANYPAPIQQPHSQVRAGQSQTTHIQEGLESNHSDNEQIQNSVQYSSSQEANNLYDRGPSRGQGVIGGVVGSGVNKRAGNKQQQYGAPHQVKPRSPAKGRRDAPRTMWQAKQDSTSLGNGNSAGSSGQARPVGSPTSGSVSDAVHASTAAVDQREKAAVTMPSDHIAADIADYTSGLHFGNFQTHTDQQEDSTNAGRANNTAAANPTSSQTSTVTTAAPARAVVSRPNATKEKEDSGNTSTATQSLNAPIASQQINPAVSSQQPTQQSAQQPQQARKVASRTQDKKPTAPSQAAARPVVPIDSGLGDELGFGQPLLMEGAHMQMNPQYYPYFVPTPFSMPELDNPQNIHSNMNYYEGSGYQASGYRATSPHQVGGDASPKYPSGYRDTGKNFGQQTQHHQGVTDTDDKHRQDSDSPPRQQHSGQTSSPPPGNHGSGQPAPHPYSMASQYPAPMYGYPYQFSYPGSQFPYQRYPPMHYSKPYPNLSSSGSTNYPLSPPTSSGYGDDLASDYGKYPVPGQSFFMPDTTGQQSGTSGSGVTSKGNFGAQASMSTSGDYKHLDYSASPDVRGASFYKSQVQGYHGQPQAQGASHAHAFPAQAGVPSQYPGAPTSSQFPFIHQPHHPHAPFPSPLPASPAAPGAPYS